MHPQAYNFVAQSVARVQLPKGAVLEIGGRDINGTVRGLFNGRPYRSIDIVDGPGVDIVANGATYRPTSSPAVVVCCEVLEHTAAAEAICRNAHRMLRPGGVFILTAASTGRNPHSAVDGGSIRPDEFYHNVSESELRRWLKPFKTAEIQVNDETHDIYAVAAKANRGSRR